MGPLKTDVKGMQSFLVLSVKELLSANDRTFLSRRWRLARSKS